MVLLILLIPPDPAASGWCTVSIKTLERAGKDKEWNQGGLTASICMGQYCFNRTPDLRLLWELRAEMRTEKQMYRDLGMELHSFLFFLLISGGLVSASNGGSVLFVCFMMKERQCLNLMQRLRSLCC